MKNKIFLFFLVAAILFCCSCKKLVQVPEPVNTITTSEVFSSAANATSAVIAIYHNLSFNNPGYSFSSGGATAFCGLSSDEFNFFYSIPEYSQFRNNLLLSNNSIILGAFWTPAYSNIYNANAVVEGLQTSNTIDEVIRKQLTGEAKFLRAFNYFYLVNLFGDVPLVTTTAWAETDTSHRTAPLQVYDQMIADLSDAVSSLPADYSLSGGERIRANKWAAEALLARVYLYYADYFKASSFYVKAEAQADSVISNEQFSLTDLNSVFLKNSAESILQWQWNSDVYPYTEPEAPLFIPYDHSSSPVGYYLTDNLVNAFDSGDNRKLSWVDTTNYSGVRYYYPYKYKIVVGTQGDVSEYYTVLRLAEQYLIRSEARAQQNNLSGAIVDLNVIRQRAGLPDLPNTLSQIQVLAAVARERQIELFAEWGHRWLDLKRTGQAESVLSAEKGIEVTVNSLLYPIPISETKTDHNLSQNPGY